MGSNDQTGQIVKGKRTKRQRSSSPFGLAMTDSSSSGCGGGGGGGAGGDRESVMDDYNSISSPTTSGEIYESTEEEEDMANCLIMLARGDAPRQLIQENHRGDADAKIEKLGTSRKFSTIVTTTNKAGFFVYECKTCNRSFPSFQALGGHRASHKKPKAAVEEKKPSLVVPVKEDFEQETGNQLNKTISSSPVSLQVTATAANNKGNKVHECSICGSEFTSGQALGGHMRRHRAAAAAAVHVTTGNRQVGTAISADTSTTNESNSGDDHHHHQVKTRSILPLDLNLPAPEDDHHQLRSDSKFQFGSTQQALVFSAPALVDCHY